jgi:hypothetical protein
MRGVIATLVAFIVLYTLAYTYPSLKTNTYATLKEERNLETIAAWIMFKASCNDVDSYLEAVNASTPLPNAPTGAILLWCNDTPVIRGFSWGP